MFTKNMKKKAFLSTFLSLVLFSAMVFGQGAGVPLSGVVEDSSGGAVSGVSVVVRNTETGVENRTTSDDRGRYTFPSLPVGPYQITAEAPGFSRYVTNQRFGVGSQNTLNISLAVAGQVTEISVTGAVESVVLEAGASTGTVMQEEILTSIPILTTNILDLVNVMGGVTPASDPSMNPGAQTFAGVAARNVNIQRDGLTVSEVSMNTGINASSNVNTDMVSEFRMVLSPVDAEMGRGAGQIQMTTRSGSNAFRGSVTWNVQNTALDAQDFSTKSTGGANGPPWRNLHNYIATVSGPIIRNRTFFFATWEHQISRVKLDYTARAMSNCAKVGIYRYIGGATPAAANPSNAMSIGGNNNAMPSVDLQGNILELGTSATFLGQSGSSNRDAIGQSLSYAAAHPSTYWGGMRPGDGELQYESVFGPLTQEARNLINQDVRNVTDPCAAFAGSGLWNPTAGQFGTNGLWDERPWGQGYDGRAGRAYRVPFDDTGYVNRFTYDLNDGSNIRMPPVNYWMGNGDGLNMASHRWTRGGIGGREGTIYGTGGDPDRKSLTIKIDHNFNSNHRVSGTYNIENFATDEHEAIWPAEYGGMGGAITRRPRDIRGSLTSTLRPTLLNEFRAGYFWTSIWTQSSIRYNPELQNAVDYLMPAAQTQGHMALIGIGESMFDFHTDSQTYNWESHPVGSRGNISASQGRDDNRITFADTVTWMKGAHSFRGGVEYRRQTSLQSVNGSLAFGRAFGGSGSVSEYPSIFGGIVSGVGDRRTGMLGQHPLTLAGDNWKNQLLRPTASRDCHATQCPGDTNAQGTTAPFTSAYQMMTYFSGSIASVTQYFFQVPEASRPYGARWNEMMNGETTYDNTIINQELSFFFKDDWRVNSSLTLNLGVRWDYYGVPSAKDGRTLSMAGGSNSIWGLATPLDDPMRFLIDKDLPAQYQMLPYGTIIGGAERDLPMNTRYEYIGKGSPNPDRMAWNKDMNNFAPHIGFAWQLPWFGRGQTTLRGGWSISYNSMGSLDDLNGLVANVSAAQPFLHTSFPGEVREAGQTRDNFGSSLHYMDLQSLSYNDPNFALPMRVRAGREPLRPLTNGYFSGTAEAIDENIQSSKTNSVNFSITRNLTRFLTLDVRYIGTLSRNGIGTININNNDFIKNGIWEELEKIRNSRTYQSDLINSLLPPGRLNTTMRDQQGVGADGTGLVPLRTLSGSDQLRHTSGSASLLMERNYSSIASTLATGNGAYTANPALGESAMQFRYGCLPELRRDPNNITAASVSNLAATGSGIVTPENPCEFHTPLNFYRNNTQHGTANIRTNTGTKSNYHSMQTQITMRPTHGLNFQATWTWAKTMSYSSWTNYLTTDRVWSSGGHSHTLNIFGNYTLPFGPRGYLFRDSSSAVRKAVEGWQIGWIASRRMGSKLSLSGTSTQWGNSWAIAVRPDLLEDLEKNQGKKQEIWTDDGRFTGGRYFDEYMYTKVEDPGLCNLETMGEVFYNAACFNTTTGQLRGSSRALALADPQRAVQMGTPTDPVTQAPWALLYDRDTLGADGIMYKAGTPVILLRNATGRMEGQTYHPLETGNYKGSRIAGPSGEWSLDMNLQKSVEFLEGKNLEFRVDAANILNRPSLTSTAPGSQRYMYGGRVVSAAAVSGISMTSTGPLVGSYAGKVGHRTFQARLRLSF